MMTETIETTELLTGSEAELAERNWQSAVTNMLYDSCRDYLQFATPGELLTVIAEVLSDFEDGVLAGTDVTSQGN